MKWLQNFIVKPVKGMLIYSNDTNVKKNKKHEKNRKIRKYK